MTQTAIVVSLNDARTATVRVMRESACGKSCESCHGCADSRDALIVNAINNVDARPGDRVVISGSTGHTLRLAALVYLLPVALFLIGWVIHPLVGALGALAAAGLVFYVNRRLMNQGGIKVYITDFDRSTEGGHEG